MKYLIIIILLFTLLISKQSLAYNEFWGPTGHRVVGEIAEKHLSRKAKRKINKLLKNQSLAFVSTYADEIKSDKKYNKFYSWHYINMPFEESYETAIKNPDGDLVTGINKCISVIKDENSSNNDKAFYLKLLIHLVGDLHQPMHVGLKEDKGGNDIKVQWHYKDSNLHRVWDSDMIEEFNMSYDELADNAELLNKTDIKNLQEGSVVDWVNETHELAKIVYKSAELNENLRYRYSYNNFTTVRKQLQIAGIRLAKILNDLF
ncbi:S1/P1 nuclease [Neotamlana laminarinivorans]|uniref:S1/P1 nuclease n=1 Tax=Neotamlana laminarinivorans TaxID=2883124 RepID=A0A9X1HXW7_9FLAO|nr:S1/P1 nuclease [Tamlana laminarinivorans]MCB4797285.1 S1/P1 nuclease [Tamlana laminarinivorans]